jgi:hypothetical protein
MNKGRRHDFRTEQRPKLDIKVILENHHPILDMPPNSRLDSWRQKTHTRPLSWVSLAWEASGQHLAGDLRQA